MPLTQLPPEIFEIVADNLDPADLLATRLVSRDISAKTLRTFAIMNFSERAIFLGMLESVLDAIDIARHPAFGPALRKLSFYIDTVERPRALGIPGGFGDGGPWEVYEAHMVVYDTQSDWISNTGLDFSGGSYIGRGLAACIGKLLSAIARLNRVEELVITDSLAVAGLPPSPHKGFPGNMWELEMMELDEAFGSFATCLLDQAVSFLHWPALQAFTMNGTGWALNPKSVMGNLSPVRETRTSTMLACASTHQLRRVTLDLQGAPLLNPDVDIRLIFCSLRQGYNLEYLDIRVAPVPDGEWLAYDHLTTDALFGQPSPGVYVALRELKVSGIMANLSALKHFLKIQPALQQFGIRQSHIDLEGLSLGELREEGDACKCVTFSRVFGVPTRVGAIETS